MHESGKAWIRANGIEAGKLREEPGQVIPEAAGCLEPFKSRISVAEAGMQYNEGDRRSLTLGRELIEFLE